MSPGITVLALIWFTGPYNQSVSIQLTIEPAAGVTEVVRAAPAENDPARDRRLTMRQKRIFVLGLTANRKK